VIRDPRSAIRIEPMQKNFEIQYTALSFINSENLRFKYKLEGLDQDWVEAGTRRTAYFSHAPPGEYTFKVIASNSDGVWNTEGQSLRIVVAPPFYRTWWFLTLIGLVVAGLVLLIYESRVWRLKQAKAEQQAFSRQLIASQEGERKRIAAELHDSLGQSLLIIKNRAALGLEAPQVPHPATEQFEEINDMASQAINEMRTIAYALRPSHLDRLGLTDVIEEMIEKAAGASGIQFSADIAQLDGFFTKEDEINFYRIIQESVNNIIKHSQATKANVEIWIESGQIHISVSDNGRGFMTDAQVGEAAPQGLGLTGMTERARMLGGAYNVKSAPGQGTTVSIRIPARAET
jgi:signal transduction histidine kinase